MSHHVELAERLRSAFPSGLATEVDDAVFVLPAASTAPSESDVGPVSLGGISLRIPSRVYFPEASRADVRRLDEVQQLVISCLYTRHCDGFIREGHLLPLLSSTHAWVAPFVFALIGEYVVEIIEAIEQQATTSMKERLSQFGEANTKFSELTRQRVISYWTCYYRSRFSRFRDYPGFRLLDTLGLWATTDARSLRVG